MHGANDILRLLRLHRVDPLMLLWTHFTGNQMLLLLHVLRSLLHRLPLVISVATLETLADVKRRRPETVSVLALRGRLLRRSNVLLLNQLGHLLFCRQTEKVSMGLNSYLRCLCLGWRWCCQAGGSDPS